MEFWIFALVSRPVKKNISKWLQRKYFHGKKTVVMAQHRNDDQKGNRTMLKNGPAAHVTTDADKFRQDLKGKDVIASFDDLTARSTHRGTQRSRFRKTKGRRS